MWKEIDTGAASGTPRSVYFINSETGWIGGDIGTLLRTADGGESWTATDTGGDRATYFIVRFFDTKFGYILATRRASSGMPGGGVLYKTADGGETLEVVKDFGEAVPVYAFFLDAETGWVLLQREGPFGSDNIVSRTEDGGATFAETKLVRPSSGSWERLVFATPDTGWVFGTPPVVTETFDGGQTWQQRVPLGSVGESLSRYWIQGDRIWAGGLVRYEYSWDRGQTWTAESPPGLSRVWVRGIHFVSEEEGWRLLLEGFGVLDRGPQWLEHSTDGGASWEREPIEFEFLADDVFATDKHVWLIGFKSFMNQEGVVLRGDRSGTETSAHAEIPSTERLLQSYPNPIGLRDAGTSIRFSLERPGQADLSIFDLQGRRVTSLVSTSLPAGEHTRRWRPEPEQAAGVYIYRLQAGLRVESRLLVLVR